MEWRDYLDKKVLHFAYFYVLWVTIQFAFKAPLILNDWQWSAGGRVGYLVFPQLLTYVSGSDKSYLATIRLGQATITDDAALVVPAATTSSQSAGVLSS